MTTASGSPHGLKDWLRSWTIRHRHSITASARSISWLSLDNLATTLINAAVSIVVARTLGATAAGIWGYAFAVYSFGLILTTLGTDQILLVDFVAAREPPRIIVATALGLRATASVVAALILICASFAIDAQTAEEAELIRVLAITLIVMALDVVSSWFRSQLRFERIVIPSIVSSTIGGAAKIFFVLHQHSILPLGYLTFAQIALMQLLILAAARRTDFRVTFRGFSTLYAREMLRTSLPLMLSGIAVFVYARANIFFLSAMDGKASVGLYNAAAAVSGIAYFIPTVIVTALTPGLYRAYNADRAAFERAFRLIGSTLTIGLAAIALIVMWQSNRIVALLYGDAFMPAASVLALHVWTLIPIAYGLTSSVWLAAEKRTSVLLIRTVCGGLVNVALNLLLIPRLGIVGAALATLLSMFTAGMLMLPLLGKTARRIFALQVRSLFLLDLFVLLFGSRQFQRAPP